MDYLWVYNICKKKKCIKARKGEMDVHYCKALMIYMK